MGITTSIRGLPYPCVTFASSLSLLSPPSWLAYVPVDMLCNGFSVYLFTSCAERITHLRSYVWKHFRFKGKVMDKKIRLVATFLKRQLPHNNTTTWAYLKSPLACCSSRVAKITAKNRTSLKRRSLGLSYIGLVQINFNEFYVSSNSFKLNLKGNFNVFILIDF